MKYHPIIFSAPNVRAILAGTKTQTRRVAKEKHRSFLNDLLANFMSGEWANRPLPYGKPGDRLWVRETWAEPTSLDPGPTFYRADYPLCVPRHFSNVPPADQIKWKPSIHMRRNQSRIDLEITGVRVERLQDISEKDAIAEGIEPTMPNPGHWNWRDYLVDGGQTHAVLSYKTLWESINGTGSWDANPLVWVIAFRKLEGGAA